MKLLGILLVFAVMTTTSYSRNTKLILPIKSAIKKGKSVGAISRHVKLQFGKRNLRGSQRKYTANRSTNAFRKSDRDACEWAFISAVKSLQDRARKKGKRRVSGIVSYYKKRTRSSASKYECHVGSIVARVVLRGNI